MKVNSIELENWRLHSKTRIDFDETATVIYGPNETGKSTILEALSRGLFDKSSSSADAIKRVKPHTAHGNVTSAVRIQLTINKEQYRLEKNFNLRKGTSLYEIVRGKPTLQSQDNDADEQLIQLLEADLPSQRGSKPSNWGALQWLWAPQDNRELPTGKEGDPTKSLHLETKETAGVLVTPKFQSVLDRANECCSRFFTQTGQRKKDSPISNMETQIQNMGQKVVELNAKIAKVAEDKQQLEELQQQLPALLQKLSETREELEKARTESADFSSIESELKTCEANLKESQRDLTDVQKALKELRDAAKEVEEVQDKEKQARDSLSSLEALCDQLEQKQKEIAAEVEKKAVSVRESEDLTRDARILWTMFDTQEKIGMLQKKIKKIADLNKKIKRLREKEIPVVPTDEELEELRDNQVRIEVLKESMMARGLAVVVKPGRKGSLEVEIDGERLEDKELSAIGTEAVSVGAPNLGKVVVSASMEKARDSKLEIQSLKENIQSVLAKYSVDSFDELRELAKNQNTISHNIKELLAEVRGIDERPINEIETDLKKLTDKHEQYASMERTSIAVKLNPTDTDLGKLVNKREKEEATARKELDAARKKRDNANDNLLKKKEELAKIRSEQNHLSEALVTARTRERETIQQHGSVDIQEKRLTAAKMALEKRQEEYKHTKKRYDDLEKGPINRVKRLEKQIENQEEIIRQQRRSIDHLEGLIDAVSVEGAYSTLGEIESNIEILSDRLDREQIRAASYQLLTEELEKQYRSALSVVVGPIREEVKRTLGYVTGFRHEDVELNEYLFPTKLGERGFEELSLEFTEASSGLKEALALCVRLAVAKHLSGKDFQCLVLDDPFVHVSSDRSNRMIELINNAMAEYRLQVIVLTHRPMEFAGLAGKMVDIQTCMS